MVYLAVCSLVAVAALQVLASGQDAQERGTQAVDARQNARAALYMMTREIRMGGSGLGPVAVIGSYNGQPFVLYPITPEQGRTGIKIAGALDSVSTRLRYRMPNSSSVLKCVDVTGFEAGDMVIVTDGVTAHLFQVTQVMPQPNELQHRPSSPYNPPGGHSQWPPQGYGPGSIVRKINIITYYFDQLTGEIIRETPSHGPVKIARGISSLSILYHLTDGRTLADPPDPTTIRGVTLQIGASSSILRAGDPASQELTTRVTPRCSIR